MMTSMSQPAIAWRTLQRGVSALSAAWRWLKRDAWRFAVTLLMIVSLFESLLCLMHCLIIEQNAMQGAHAGHVHHQPAAVADASPNTFVSLPAIMPSNPNVAEHAHIAASSCFAQMLMLQMLLLCLLAMLLIIPQVRHWARPDRLLVLPIRFTPNTPIRAPPAQPLLTA